MTLQQLEYIIALNRYRNFVRAAEACHIAQPTLSAMIQKLEDELGVKLFDRSKHPVAPTEIGVRIIRQAENALSETLRIKEMIQTESETLNGTLQLGIIPTVAPYIVPEFIRYFSSDYPNIVLNISEMRTEAAIRQLRNGNIDIAILSTPLNESDLLEIPLYYERFMAYFSSEKPVQESLSVEDLPVKHLWILQEGHCFRNQLFNFCQLSTHSEYHKIYEAGSITTLINIVDKNGGWTIIPELHLPFLNEAQRKKVREIEAPPAVREISILIRQDYIRERILNAVADTIKKIVPLRMIDKRLKNFSIRL